MTTANRTWWVRGALWLWSFPAALWGGKSPAQCELEREIERGKTKRAKAANGRAAIRIDEHRATFAVVLLVLAGSFLSGCAALKAIGPVLLEYGIAGAQDLAEEGREAIDAARKRAESIPNQLDRIEAMEVCARADRIFIMLQLEALIADAYGDDVTFSEPDSAEAPEPTAAN